MFLQGIVLRVEEEVFLQSKCSLGRLLGWIHPRQGDVVPADFAWTELSWWGVYMCGVLQ